MLTGQGIFARYEPQKAEISTTQNVEIKQAHITMDNSRASKDNKNTFHFLFSGYFGLQDAQEGQNFNHENC